MKQNLNKQSCEENTAAWRVWGLIFFTFGQQLQTKYIRKLQHLHNYNCVNDQKKSDSFRFTLITNNAVSYCRCITPHQPHPLNCLTFNPKRTEIVPYLTWWVGTVLQKHTTSTSSGLLKTEAVLSSEALISIYQTAWCPKSGNIIWIFTIVKTQSKECKNINYQGWMFHYEKKRNYKYSIMFLNSHYKSVHFLSLKWNKKAKTSRYFLVTNIITIVYRVNISLMLAEVNYKRKQTKNSPRWKTTDKINPYVWLCLTCPLILLKDQQQTTMNWYLITKNFCVLHVQSNTTIVVVDCTCNTQKFSVIEPTQWGWHLKIMASNYDDLVYKITKKFSSWHWLSRRQH